MKALIKDSDGGIRVIADSAVGRNGQPWFVPQFGGQWAYRLALAVRVGRLGKSLTPKFAERYVDAMTLLWVPQAGGAEVPGYMDVAIVCGAWLEPSEAARSVYGALCEVSALATMKTGDIVAVTLPGEPREISPGQHISEFLEEHKVLEFNIK